MWSLAADFGKAEAGYWQRLENRNASFVPPQLFLLVSEVLGLKFIDNLKVTYLG
jgi:hypothetical protein